MALNPHAIEITALVLLAPLVWLGLALRNLQRPFTARPFLRFAARRGFAVLAVGVAALAIRAALLPLHPPPEPYVVDENSYLLAGDTFASGRAANPPHPFWIHFETICVLSQPKVASKYPPGQGLVLAAGILLAQKPWVGVWLSIGAMCASIVWMLQGWVSPRWALLGGILVLLRIAVGSYWIDSYWGGAVAATGGALFFGAVPRLMRQLRLRHSLVLGVGLAILANSRPFEGLVVSTPALLVLAAWVFRRGWPAVRALIPMVAVLVAAAGSMLMYNRAVTGSPWQMPYQLHETQYAIAPLFLFQNLRPEPVYHHASIKAFWTEYARDEYLRSFRMGLAAASLEKLEAVRSFFLGPLLTLPLLALPWAWHRKGFRLVYISLGVLLCAQLAVIGVLPHYTAPATALIYLVVVQCLRHVRISGPAGRVLVRSIPAVLACTMVLFYSLEASGYKLMHEHFSWCFATVGNLDRARLLRQLEATPGRHLVMVRYGPAHVPNWEWVYNRAHIDEAKVVWAREMDVSRNRRLLEYFHARQVWLVEPDTPHPVLKPYGDQLGRLFLTDEKR